MFFLIRKYNFLIKKYYYLSFKFLKKFKYFIIIYFYRKLMRGECYSFWEFENYVWEKYTEIVIDLYGVAYYRTWSLVLNKVISKINL